MKDISIKIAIAVVVLFIGRAIYYKNMWINEKVELIELLESKINRIEEKEDSILNLSKNKIIKSINKNKSINNKFKNDEKIINNRNISSDELDEFLSRYEN